MVETLQLQMWGSRGALFAHMKADGLRGLIVGRDVEAATAYYSCSMEHGGADGEIAIVSAGLGSTPTVVVMGRGRRALIGHDLSLTSVDTSAMTLVGSLSLTGVFFEFIPVEGDDEIVVVHEVGVLRVDANAAIKWSVECDVIEDFSVDGQERLVLSTMDGAQLAISLQSGVVSRECRGRGR
jgi:hypothetical protein